MVMVGEKVQDFELKAFHNEQEKMIKLSDYKGKWIILFFGLIIFS